MGSGKMIKRAELKYGLSAFTKEILFDYDNFNDMNNKEKELVQLSNCYPLDPMSYNIKEGGLAGQFTEDSKRKIGQNTAQIWKNKPEEEKQKIRDQRSKCMSGESNAMRGKSVLDYMSNEEITEWKHNIGKSSKELWKNENYRNQILSQTLQKPGIDHDCRKYMTDDEIKQWKENLSIASSGEHNSMYGKNSWENFSGEKRKKRIDKFKKSMKGKNKGKRCMKHPNE